MSSPIVIKVAGRYSDDLQTAVHVAPSQFTYSFAPHPAALHITFLCSQVVYCYYNPS